MNPGADHLETARLWETVEGEAVTDSHLALQEGLAKAMDFSVERLAGGYLEMLPSVNEVFFNRVFGLGLAEPITEELLDDVTNSYKSRGINRFAVQLSPASQPAHAADWLAARGFRFTDNWVKMYRGTEPPPDITTSLTLQEIGPERAADFARVVRSGFPEITREFSPWLEGLVGRPGWRHFMAFAGDEPVASGSLFIRGDVGWLSFGSTLPSYRRLGAQGALMARRIQEGIAAGCRWLVSEAEEDLPDRPNPSYHNMIRTGFRPAYPRANYIVEF